MNENSPGALQSFTIDDDGQLSAAVDTVASGGDAPAFTVPLSTGQVAIMNVRSFFSCLYFALIDLARFFLLCSITLEMV